MKRLFIACMAVVVAMAAKAQSENGIFNHLSIGVNAGTPGIGLDMAMPITEHFSLRAGYTLMPSLKASTNLDINTGRWSNVSQKVGGTSISVPNEVEVEGKTGIGHAKVLLDIFPVKSSSFHFTFGAYYGSSDKILSVKNNTSLMSITEANKAIDAYNALTDANESKIGVELGDYLLTTDQNGNVNGEIKVKKLKPYAGIGFGRAVPHNRVGLMLEAGCMFWGKPQVFCNDHELVAGDFDGDASDILKTVSKIQIYPVINLRFTFRAY